MQHEFFVSNADEPHAARTRAILAAHPEVRQLIGRNPWTALIMAAILALQVSIAWGMGQLGLQYWWIALIVAFAVGAFANHAMYVVIHDATHDLIFRNRTLNRIVGLLADLPNLAPGATGFRVYHLKHHAHQGQYDLDADMPSRWEAALVGNRWYAKAIWLLLFPIFEALRPARLKAIPFLSKWFFINLAGAAVFDAIIYLTCGWNGLLYLAFSLFFSIGLHPLGGRWIQEHYTNEPDQETFSYYGPLNRVALNVGYHNEHHDFPSIPWNRLPTLRAMAPEFYDTLKHHTSWTKLVINFIFDPSLSLYSRVERHAEVRPAPQSAPARVRAAA